MKIVARQFLKSYFGVSLILVMADLLWLAMDKSYGTKLGGLNSIPDYAMVVFPPLLLFVYYSVICYGIFVRQKALNRGFLVAQAIFFSILSVLICIPFGGYFFVSLSPIDVLYFGGMILLPNVHSVGYFILWGLPLMLLLINIAVVVVAVRTKKVSTALH